MLPAFSSTISKATLLWKVRLAALSLFFLRTKFCAPLDGYQKFCGLCDIWVGKKDNLKIQQYEQICDEKNGELL